MTRDFGLRRFTAGAYAIVDDDFLTTGEVTIASGDPLPPRLGDLYTIESHGKLHEVQVAETQQLPGCWTARCKLYGLVES